MFMKRVNFTESQIVSALKKQEGTPQLCFANITRNAGSIDQRKSAHDSLCINPGARAACLWDSMSGTIVYGTSYMMTCFEFK